MSLPRDMTYLLKKNKLIFFTCSMSIRRVHNLYSCHQLLPVMKKKPLGRKGLIQYNLDFCMLKSTYINTIKTEFSQIFLEKFSGDIFYFILNNVNIIISQFYNFLLRAISVLQLGQ